MSEAEESPERVLSLLCENKSDGTWTIALLAGSLPPRLASFFDENFESKRLILDFDHLTGCLERYNATCKKHVTTLGDVELLARGQSVRALSSWLVSSLGSTVLSTSPRDR